MVLRLHQSGWSPHKSIYRNNFGQALYKVETPRALRNQVSTIYRVIPNSDPGPSASTSANETASTSTLIPFVPYDGGQEGIEMSPLRQRSQKAINAFREDHDEEDGTWAEYDSDKGSRKGIISEESTPDMQDRFEVLARIEWSLFGSSTFDWGDTKHRTNDFFSRSGFYGMGPGKKWTGPDGRTYKWQMGSWKPTLVLMDGSSDPPLVATFHRASILHPYEKEWLEIYPEGEGIVDAILFTYIYVERIRKNRERAARHNGGGGG